MIQVENFLCVFDLYKGGLWIGWFNVVMYFFAAVGLMVFPFFTDKKGKFFLEKFETFITNNFRYTVKAVAFIGAIILLGVVGTLAYISYRLIQGIKTVSVKCAKIIV